MGIERQLLSPSTTHIIDSGTGRERVSSSTDSSSSNSVQDVKRIARYTGIPTIEISDPRDDRSPEANSFKAKDGTGDGLAFGLNSRTPSPIRPLRDSGSKLAALKKKTYHVLSFGHNKDDVKSKDHEDGLLKAPFIDEVTPSESPLWKRRAASMPVPSLEKQAHRDILHHADPVATRSYLACGSPPIVDFTRFEDRYRSPSSDYDALLSVSRGNKGDDERKAITSFFSSRRERKDYPRNVSALGFPMPDNKDRGKPGRVETVGRNELVRDLSRRNVLYPANERKPDPRLIVDALESASGIVDIRRLLNVDDLLRIHGVDQQNFELRERVKGGRRSKPGSPRTVFGETIQNVFDYASATIILGEREYILPILVIHCVEEVYRTGIYQPNLFRTLPHRPRLHELISTFDSEEQVPGSIIRSRSSSFNLEGLGFGAATSLHLEATPDICALLTSYLSALPEPILPTDLFEAIWILCEIDQQSHIDLLEQLERPPSQITFPLSDLSAPVRLSSIPLARSYTSQSEATYILIAQLFLHLLPSPHFFLFVYLLSFFSQVALVREENGVGVEDLSKMFGSQIFGHGDVKSGSTSYLSSSKSKGKAKEKENNGRGEAMMVWFLRRWGHLSETLFEVVDDVKLGILHRNKRMRKDSLGKATSAYTSALSAHEAVESERYGEQDDGERDDKTQILVERELLEDGEVHGNVDLPEPVKIVSSPPTIHVPFTVDSQDTLISLERKGPDLLPVPQRNAYSSGIVTMSKDSPHSRSSVSSGSSSSTLPPYADRPSPKTIEPDFNANARFLHPDLPNAPPDIHLSEASLPGDNNLCHSTPKDDFGNRILNSLIGDSDYFVDRSCLSRIVGPRQKDEVLSGGIDVVDQSVEVGDGESVHSLPSLHERLLDVSMPTSIFDLDETMPVRGTVDDNSRSSTSTPMTLKRAEPRPVKIIEKNLTPGIASISRIPSNTELKRLAPNNVSGISPLISDSDSRRLSVSDNAFLSPRPAPQMPSKSPEYTQGRSKLRLPISRSVGFQKGSHFSGASMPAAAVSRENDSSGKDAVISALRARLVAVEKERDEAKRIVTEVRRVLRNVDDGPLHTLLM